MATVHLTNNTAALHIERGEQRGRTVADVVMGPPFHLARAQGENGLGAVQRLNLRLLIDRQHERTIGPMIKRWLLGHPRFHAPSR